MHSILQFPLKNWTINPDTFRLMVWPQMSNRGCSWLRSWPHTVIYEEKNSKRKKKWVGICMRFLITTWQWPSHLLQQKWNACFRSSKSVTGKRFNGHVTRNEKDYSKCNTGGKGLQKNVTWEKKYSSPYLMIKKHPTKKNLLIG